MYNRNIIEQLVDFISTKAGKTDKNSLQNEVQYAFKLVKERSIYYCDWFAIRFCKAASRSFCNTVLALSVLHRYDGIPFIVCLVTPTCNYLMLANTTFLRKISHSSQELRRDNIKGSFNGSDIMREFEGIVNYNIAAKKKGDDIVFLRKIVRGAADDSYGIEVAKLAGVPKEVTKRAKEILETLEAGGIQKKERTTEPSDDDFALSFDNISESEVAEKLRAVDINTLTPLEAINLIYELKKMLS